jgi:hypothetical protein
MTGAETLAKAIQQIEAEARRLIAEAASSGRFDEVEDLTPLAKEISELAIRWNGRRVNGASLTPPVRPSASTDSTKAAPPARTRKDAYPKFVRERDDMVKIGWSTRERAPYEHRVPKRTLDAVAKVIGKKAQTGRRFTIDELIKSLPAADLEIPIYQVYAVVLWLKHNGMLSQHGRQGYTAVRAHTLSDSIESAWQTLSRR